MLQAMRRLGLAELYIKIGLEQVRIRRRQKVRAPVAAAPQTAGVSRHSHVEPDEPGRHAVRAAVGGTFFTAPRPGAPPFVRVGDEVEAGTVLGLIEAMKVFNEVNADRAGRVLRILGRSGDVVAAGALLVIMDVGAELAGRMLRREGV